MKVCIYGAGAMGTVLGSYLTRAGELVDLVSHNFAHIEGLKKHGAIISGTTDFTVSVSALHTNEMKMKYDIIFLMTKQLDNEAVCVSLLPYLDDNGVIVTMQNGIPETSVSKVIGEDKTIGSAMAWGATMLGEGQVKLTTKASYQTLSFSLGRFAKTKHPYFDEVARLLRLMGEVKIEENWLGARYAKLMINSAFSGLSVVLNATFGEIAENKTTRRMAQLIIKECIEVAKKGNIKIEPIQGKDIVKLLDYKHPLKQWISFQIIPIAMKKHKDIISSMLQDLERNRPCEISAINGVISDFGNQFAVETPYNDAIINIVKDFEKKNNHPGMHNLNYLSKWIH